MVVGTEAQSKQKFVVFEQLQNHHWLTCAFASGDYHLSEYAFSLFVQAFRRRRYALTRKLLFYSLRNHVLIVRHIRTHPSTLVLFVDVLVRRAVLHEIVQRVIVALEARLQQRQFFVILRVLTVGTSRRRVEVDPRCRPSMKSRRHCSQTLHYYTHKI